MAKSDQIRGKLARAILVIEEFRRAERDFIRTRATKAQADDAGGLRIEIKPIPVSLSAIAGDALQDLRPALDHEVHRIGEAAKGPKWPGLEGCEFPIKREQRRYASARKGAIGGIPLAVQRVIDSMQPCLEPRDPEANSLELLNELARIDRHRLLHLTVMQVTGLSTELRPLDEVKPGSIIGVVGPETKEAIRVEMKMRLAFAEAPAQGAAVGETLVKLASAVRRVLQRLREAEPPPKRD